VRLPCLPGTRDLFESASLGFWHDLPGRRWAADAAEFEIHIGESDAQIELSGRVTRQAS